MTSPAENQKPYRIAVATAEDRAAIAKMRHAVYASELEALPTNAQGKVRDSIDEYNHYIVAKTATEGGGPPELVGFVSITPPGFPTAVGKHYPEKTFTGFEARLLTVAAPQRNKAVASTLVYATYRCTPAGAP